MSQFIDDECMVGSDDDRLHDSEPHDSSGGKSECENPAQGQDSAVAPLQLLPSKRKRKRQGMQWGVVQ